MEEYKVGEVFQFGRKKLKCVETNRFDCIGCTLIEDDECRSFVGRCEDIRRSDRKNVIFIEVKEEENET